MAINKVVYGNETLIDLTSDSVTPETLDEGVTAHSADGERIVGTASRGTPVFDLVAMGMPVHEVGVGEFTLFECDTTEMRSAMMKGPVCFIIQTNYGSAMVCGSPIMVEAMPNPQIVSAFQIGDMGDFSLTVYEDSIEVFSAFRVQSTLTEERVNELINEALGVIENGTY